MQVDGSPGAGVFEHQQLIHMAGTICKRKVEQCKDRTFLTRIPAAPEASALESAPCSDMNSAQPVNPRKRGN